MYIYIYFICIYTHICYALLSIHLLRKPAVSIPTTAAADLLQAKHRGSSLDVNHVCPNWRIFILSNIYVSHIAQIPNSYLTQQSDRHGCNPMRYVRYLPRKTVIDLIAMATLEAGSMLDVELDEKHDEFRADWA